MNLSLCKNIVLGMLMLNSRKSRIIDRAADSLCKRFAPCPEAEEFIICAVTILLSCLCYTCCVLRSEPSFGYSSEIAFSAELYIKSAFMFSDKNSPEVSCMRNGEAAEAVYIRLAVFSFLQRSGQRFCQLFISGMYSESFP